MNTAVAVQNAPCRLCIPPPHIHTTSKLPGDCTFQCCSSFAPVRSVLSQPSPWASVHTCHAATACLVQCRCMLAIAARCVRVCFCCRLALRTLSLAGPAPIVANRGNFQVAVTQTAATTQSHSPHAIAVSGPSGLAPHLPSAKNDHLGTPPVLPVIQCHPLHDHLWTNL